jgi:hypothetical protein
MEVVDYKPIKGSFLVYEKGAIVVSVDLPKDAPTGQWQMQIKTHTGLDSEWYSENEFVVKVPTPSISDATLNNAGNVQFGASDVENRQLIVQLTYNDKSCELFNGSRINTENDKFVVRPTNTNKTVETIKISNNLGFGHF